MSKYVFFEGIVLNQRRTRMFSFPDYLTLDGAEMGDMTNRAEGEKFIARLSKGISDTIESNDILTKIASQDTVNTFKDRGAEGEMVDKPYSEATAEMFWTKFREANPELYRELLASYPHITNFKIAMIGTGNKNIEQFKNYDRVKQRDRKVPSFINYMRSQNV
jgi:hypothetical protein